jgi:hypothetical protein
VVRVVRFRDAMFPDNSPFFSVADEDVSNCRVPLAIAPGNSELAPHQTGIDIAATAPGAKVIDGGAAGTVAFIEGALQRR